MSQFNSNSNDPTRRMIDYVDYMSNQTLIKSDDIINSKLKTTYVKSEQNIPSFPDDVLAYYDFSNPDNVGYDYSGKGNHLLNPFAGVKYVADTQRTNALDIYYPVTSSASATPAVLVAPNANLAISLRSTTLTIAFWIYPRSTQIFMIWCTTDPSSGQTNTPTQSTSQTMCFLENGNLYIQNVKIGQIGPSAYMGNIGGVAQNQWTHVCITTSTANGTKWYKNGVLTAVGETRTLDMGTGSTATTFAIGALPAPKTYTISANSKIDQYTYFQTNTKLSDMIFLNRELTQAEVTSLFEDNYGYDVFPIAGQSNAVGKGTIETGLDDDYSIIANKVYSYKTNTNIDGTYAVVASTIESAVNPLQHPTTVAGTTGLWLQFSRDMVQYANRPFRRKILIVPCAVDGSSLSAWQPVTGAHFRRSVSAINDALNENKLNKLQALLWNQGESEISVPNLNFKANLLAMITGYENQIPQFTTSLPKVMAEISCGNYDPYMAGTTHMKTFVKAKMLEICDADSSWRLILTGDLSFLKEGTTVHYDASGLRKLGSRYVDSYLSILKTVNLRPTIQLAEYSANATLKTIIPNMTIFCNMATAGFTLTLPSPSTGVVPNGTKFTIIAYQPAVGENATKILTLTCTSGNKFRAEDSQGTNTASYIFTATAGTVRVVVYNNTYYIT